MKLIRGYLIDKYMSDEEKIEVAWNGIRMAALSLDFKELTKHYFWLKNLIKKTTIQL